MYLIKVFNVCYILRTPGGAFILSEIFQVNKIDQQTIHLDHNSTHKTLIEIYAGQRSQEINSTRWIAQLNNRISIQLIN